MGKIANEIDKEEKHLLMLLSETSLKKTWDNSYDSQWDNIF
jgi:hypothetical protein